MKKSLLFFICLLFISLFSRAQEWNFSSSAFNALGDIITTTTIDGLTIYAASDKVVTVDASAKSIHGIDFTNRLKLGGAGNLSAGLPVSRVLTFPVGGPVTISIALQSSSSSADRELCLVSSVSGDTLHIFPAPGAAASWEEYSYTGGIDTLYMLSKASGINIYYIKSEVVVEPAPEGIITGGNMENATAWSVASWEATVAAEPTYTFNYTTDVPAAGAGGCLRIQAENPGTGSGSVNSMCYQQVTLEPGETYTFSGAFKDITPDSVSNFWCEIGLSKTDPSVAEGRTVNFFMGMNTWDGCGAGLNGTFQDDNCKYTRSFTVPEDGTAAVTYYLVILTGQWNNVADHFDVLLDQLSLTKVYDPNVLKKGNMEVASAWSVASWEATVAAEPTYTFNYTTDVPAAGAGGCLRIQAENPGTGSGSVNSMCYQQVTLEPGETYTFSGAFKDITPDSVSNFWCEIGLSKTDPSVAEGRTVNFFMGMNTWDGCGAGLNGTFQDDNCKYTRSFTVPEDGTAAVTYYLVILTGQWNNVADHFDVLLDQLSLTKVYDPNVLKKGNMEVASAWSVASWEATVAAEPTYTFNYTTDVPAAGAGGCLRIQAENPGTGSGSVNSMCYQQVTLEAGETYTFSGAFKDITPDSVSNFWCEIGLSKTDPSVAEGRTVNFFMGMNTWDGCGAGLNGTFQDDNCKYTGTFTVPADPAGEVSYYFVILTGQWNNVADHFDVLLDQLSLTKYVPVVETWTELPVENVVFGAVDSPEDFTGNVSLKWDVDSLYMIFDVVDDSIVTKGNAYQVDNIEIYFDMDNSKNIHWPRNGGWVKSIDDAYDLNDYQLRLVPGVSFGVNNKVRPTSASIDSTGCNQVYMKTDSGYKFELTVPWETLLPGFDAAAGKLFGFDVLWSDNDATATDANRNQITWNSPTDRTFNDPSLFGVLQLTPSGSFTSVLDTEKPSNPANLVAVATGSNVLLTWDASTDNRVVQSYILFDKTTAVDTILAVKTGNKFTFKNLTAGSHRFGVTAVDVYGNKSSKTSTDNFTVSVNNLAKSRIQLYPNPTTGVVNISADDSKLTNLSVYNVVGELVRSVEFTKSLTLDLSANLKGVYFLHLTSDGNTQISKLIIK